MNDVRNNIDELLTDYFYILDLNKMFCDGIRHFNKSPERTAMYNQVVHNWFNKWLDHNCSHEAYSTMQHEVSKWDDEPELMNQFTKMYAGKFLGSCLSKLEFNRIFIECQSLGIPMSKPDGTLIITRDSLVSLLKKTSQFSIDNYVALTGKCHNGRER